jgi:hypothetical protein
MANVPTGGGQTDAAHSASVVFASDAAAPAAPAGSSTSAIQATQQTSLTSIDGKLSAQKAPLRSTNCYAIAVTATTGGTAVQTLLTGTDLGADIAAGKEFVMTADGADIWWLSDTGTSGVLSNTATNASHTTNIPDYLPAGSSTPPMKFDPAVATGAIASFGSNANGMLRIRCVT